MHQRDRKLRLLCRVSGNKTGGVEERMPDSLLTVDLGTAAGLCGTTNQALRSTLCLPI